MPPSVMSSLPPSEPVPAPPRIAARAPRALRGAMVALAGLAGIAVSLSDLPAWVAIVVPLLCWLDWPLASSTIPWSTDIARRGPLVVVSRRHVFLADARERREIALWMTRHV